MDQSPKKLPMWREILDLWGFYFNAVLFGPCVVALSVIGFLFHYVYGLRGVIVVVGVVTVVAPAILAALVINHLVKERKEKDGSNT